jgi:hypothetical protein
MHEAQVSCKRRPDLCGTHLWALEPCGDLSTAPPPPAALQRRVSGIKLAGLAFSALGVVFGDIGAHQYCRSGA